VVSDSVPAVRFRRPASRIPRRASVVGAGSFGTAVAVLLVRAGLRTTLLCRTEEQARLLLERGESDLAASRLIEPYSRLTEGLDTGPAAEARALLGELGVEATAAIDQAVEKPSSG
jgi:glycerol-3-phosphate dehydrogenase (NAD(P)+)